MGFDFGALIAPTLNVVSETIKPVEDAAKEIARNHALTHLANINSIVSSDSDEGFIGPPEPTYNPPDSIDSFNDIAGIRSIADRFNMSPGDVNAYVNTIAKEAYLGKRQKDGTYSDIGDIHTVGANLLTRLLHPGYPKNMKNVVNGNAYEANEGLTPDQLSTANIVGLPADEWSRIKEAALDPLAVYNAAKASDFAEEYRGLSPQTKRGINPKTGQLDYMPVEGKSNFYFYPAPQTIQDKFHAKFAY